MSNRVLGSYTSLQFLQRGYTTKQCIGSASFTLNEEFELEKVTKPKYPSKPKEEQKERKYKINKQKIRSRLLTHINCQRGYKQLYMLTITFPPMVGDDIAYKLLNLFFTEARQQHLLKSYLWVAERQKNGTIHYHVAITHYVKIQALNCIMRDNIKKYIRKGLIAWTQSEAHLYNGCDLAKDRQSGRITNYADVRNKKLLGAYITKYVTKNTEEFKHLAWHNSRDFSAIFLKQAIELAILKKIHASAIEMLSAPFVNDYCATHFWNTRPPNWATSKLYSINDSILHMKGYYEFKSNIASKWNFKKVSKEQLN